jgi:hypothetical protein
MEDYEPPTFCAICGDEIKYSEICEDCVEAIEAEGIDPYDENPYDEYGFDHPWELDY